MLSQGTEGDLIHWQQLEVNLGTEHLTDLVADRASFVDSKWAFENHAELDPVGIVLNHLEMPDRREIFHQVGEELAWDPAAVGRLEHVELAADDLVQERQ